MLHRVRAAAAAVLAATLTPSPPAQQPGPAAPDVIVRARLLDEVGRPLSAVGAAIAPLAEARASDSALDAPMARSGDDGRLELRCRLDADLAEPLVLWFAQADRASYRVPLWLEPGAHGPHVRDLGDVRLPPGVHLSGVVRSSDGEPIAGAHVAVHDLLQPRGTWAGYAASTRADARGRFRVRGTFGSACSMRVEAPGFYTRQLPWISIGMPFDVSLEASGFVHGAVVDDDGAPLEGFVLLLHEYASTEPGSAVRLTAGRYRLPIAMRGRFRVAVFDAQDLPLVESDVLAGPGEVPTLVHEPEASNTLVVKVLDGTTHDAAAGARAAAHGFGQELVAQLFPYLEAELRVADRDGAVRLAKQGMAEPQILAVADRCAPLLFVTTRAAHDGAVQVELPRAQRLAGVVQAAETHAPLASVEVRCRWTGRGEADAVLPEGSVGLPKWLRTRTAEDGTFVLEGLAPGTYDVVAHQVPYGITTHATVEVRSDGSHDDLTLALARGATLTVRFAGDTALDEHWQVVVARADADDSAEPDAAHSYWDLGPSELWNVTDGVPIPERVVRIPHLGPGRHRLTLVAPAAPRSTGAMRVHLAQVELADEDAVLEVDAERVWPVALTGTVDLGRLDVPADRLVVTVCETGAARVPWSQQLGHDGRFELLAPPGRVTLGLIDAATGLEVMRRAYRIEPGTPLDVRLEPQLAVLRVRFADHDGDWLPTQSLRVHAGAADGLDTVTLLGGGRFGRPGVDYLGTWIDLPMLVPAGRIRVGIEPGAGRLSMHGNHFLPANTIDDTVELRAGERRVHVLPLPEPAKLDDG